MSKIQTMDDMNSSNFFYCTPITLDYDFQIQASVSNDFLNLGLGMLVEALNACIEIYLKLVIPFFIIQDALVDDNLWLMTRNNFIVALTDTHCHIYVLTYGHIHEQLPSNVQPSCIASHHCILLKFYWNSTCAIFVSFAHSLIFTLFWLFYLNLHLFRVLIQFLITCSAYYVTVCVPLQFQQIPHRFTIKMDHLL